MRIARSASLCLFTALASCSRPTSTNVPEAGTPALDAAPAIEAASLDEPPPATFREARRAHLAKLDDEPGLAKSEAAIRAHFGGVLPAAMDLQAVPFALGRQALYLEAAGGEVGDAKPIVLLVDATGDAIWTRERPLGGIVPPAGPVAIAPRPDGGLVLFFYDAPTKLIAARMWTPEGGPFAELMLFHLPQCDAISAAWWPGNGWIVVASFPGGARALRVSEEGLPAWPPEGLAVGEPWRAPAPATIVIDDTTFSWVLVQHATRGGSDHVVAVRYGLDGTRLTKKAVDLGAVPRVADPRDRIDATLAGPGRLRVDVGGTAVETGGDRAP
jgi:hypothetical protein